MKVYDCLKGAEIMGGGECRVTFGGKPPAPAVRRDPPPAPKVRQPEPVKEIAHYARRAAMLDRDPERLCARMGASVRPMRPDDPSKWFGCWDEGRNEIRIRDGLPPSTRRRIASHELGHLMAFHSEPAAERFSRLYLLCADELMP
jgi:hypothetical protein